MTPDLRRRFTLVEMLVVIAVILVLASLLLPSLSKSYELAVTISCGNNLHMLSQSMESYRSDHAERYALAYSDAAYASNWSTSATSGRWFHYLEPYTRTYAIMNCPKMNETKPGTQVNDVAGSNIGGWTASWGAMPRGRAVVGGVCNYAYNNINVANRTYKQVEALARTCQRNPRPSNVVAMMDGVFLVYSTTFGGGLGSALDLDNHYIHNQKTNVYYLDGRVNTVGIEQFSACEGTTFSASPWMMIFTQ